MTALELPNDRATSPVPLARNDFWRRNPVAIARKCGSSEPLPTSGPELLAACIHSNHNGFFFPLDLSAAQPGFGTSVALALAENLLFDRREMVILSAFLRVFPQALAANMSQRIERERVASHGTPILITSFKAKTTL